MKKVILILNPDHGIPDDAINSFFRQFDHEASVIIESPTDYVIPPPPARNEKCTITNAHVTKSGLERDLLRGYTLLRIDGYDGWTFRIRVWQKKLWCTFSPGGVHRWYYLVFYDDIVTFLNDLGRIHGPRSAIRAIRTLVSQSPVNPISQAEVERRMNWDGTCPNEKGVH